MTAPEPATDGPVAVATAPFTNEETESYRLVADAKAWLDGLEQPGDPRTEIAQQMLEIEGHVTDEHGEVVDPKLPTWAEIEQGLSMKSAQDADVEPA